MAGSAYGPLTAVTLPARPVMEKHKDQAAILADASITYAKYSGGELFQTRDLAVLELADEGATDHHFEGADGAKFYEAGPNFSTFERLEQAVARGWSWENDRIVMGGMYPFTYSDGATTVSRIPNVVPVAPVYPEHHGASGGDIQGDTTAVTEWLQHGGGRTPDGSVYLIDPIAISNDIDVRMGDGSMFKARAWFPSSSTEDGLIRVTDSDVTFHGKIDGNRDSATISAGVAAMRGTSESDIETADKSGLMVRSIASDVRVDINLIAVNCPGKGLHLKGADGFTLDGHVRRVTVRDSGAVARLDRCTNLSRGIVEGYNIDNRIGGDNDEWMPGNNHAIQMLRCVDSPGRIERVIDFTGRPGRYMNEVDTPFMNGVTHSACGGCRTETVEIINATIARGGADDSGADDIAGLSTLLGFSDVANIASGVDQLVFSGTGTQAWELIPADNGFYGKVVLRGNHGLQNVASGASGVNMHGGVRTREDVADFRNRAVFTTSVQSLDVEGFHFGVWQRKGTLKVGRFRGHGNRRNAVLLNNNGQTEWPGAAPQKPAFYADSADIQWNGGAGISVVNGHECIINGGKIANNAQMAGYDDPTIIGGSVEQRYAVIHPSNDPDADTVDAVILRNVDTRNDPAITDLKCSYIPGTPATSTYFPDDRLRFITMTFETPKNIHIGQRLTVKDVDGAGQDVDVWVRGAHGDAVFCEVDHTTFAGAWVDSDTALTGTWDLTGNRLDGTVGALQADLDGPAVVKTPNGYALLTTIEDDDTAFLAEEAPWGIFGTISGDFTGQSISFVERNADYGQGQTGAVDLYHSNVSMVSFDPLVMSEQFQLADDTIYEVTPPWLGGFAYMSANFDQDTPSDAHSAALLFDVGASLKISKSLEPSASIAEEVEVTTSDVDETTATDGKVTVCALAGSLRIINRSGFARSFRLKFL